MRLISSLIILIFLFSCSKQEKVIYEISDTKDPYSLYKEGYEAFEKNDFFFASKKFSEAELNFKNVDLAAKSSIMSAFSLYSINFYDEALDSLDRFLKIYPSDKNVVYAHFLSAVKMKKKILNLLLKLVIK